MGNRDRGGRDGRLLRPLSARSPGRLPARDQRPSCLLRRPRRRPADRLAAWPGSRDRAATPVSRQTAGRQRPRGQRHARRGSSLAARSPRCSPRCGSPISRCRRPGVVAVRAPRHSPLDSHLIRERGRRRSRARETAAERRCTGEREDRILGRRAGRGRQRRQRPLHSPGQHLPPLGDQRTRAPSFPRSRAAITSTSRSAAPGRPAP